MEFTEGRETEAPMWTRRQRRSDVAWTQWHTPVQWQQRGPSSKAGGAAWHGPDIIHRCYSDGLDPIAEEEEQCGLMAWTQWQWRWSGRQRRGPGGGGWGVMWCGPNGVHRWIVAVWTQRRRMRSGAAWTGWSWRRSGMRRHGPNSGAAVKEGAGRFGSLAASKSKSSY
jgi:hypothetical protein